jgi:DNA-binding CsgD family transcriptional regulator
MSNDGHQNKMTLRKREQAIATSKRRKAIWQMWLQGVRSQCEMAARLGISQPAVCNHLKAIQRQLKEEDVKGYRNKQLRRINQFEMAAKEAFDAWQKSKESVEQIQTEYVRKDCPLCKQREKEEASAKKSVKRVSMKKEKPCEVCNGNGYIMQENIIRRVTGKAGDAALIQQYWFCMREAAKLEGLYERNKRPIPPGQETHLHAHVHGDMDWSKVPADQLLQLKQAYSNAEEASKTAIDVESKPE